MIVVGLGNPGLRYENTRHNIGFMVLDNFAKKYNIKINKKKFNCNITNYVFQGTNILLLKPQNFMNTSGECLKKVVNYYNIKNQEIIVIYDDISLELLTIKIKQKGSSGGHNGIKNIIDNLNTDEFIRIKVGIGPKEQSYDLADFVLSKFEKSKEQILQESIEKSIYALELILKNGVSYAMNMINQKN